MYDQPIRHVMTKTPFLTAPPTTTISEAATLMAARNVGHVLVVDGELLVGIFTERDAVYRVMARGLDLRTTTLAEVMTPSPRTVGPDQPFGIAMAMMHKYGFRRVPVVVDGRPVGLVAARNALDPDLEDFVPEARRRERYSEAI
jgi:CBS domain-containing protein